MSQDELWAIATEQFFPRRLRLRSQHTRKQYRYAINNFGECLGHPATLDDLDDDALTVWLGRLLDSGLSTYTVREKIGRVLTLWRWAASRGMVQKWPTVQRPEPPEVEPVAMTPEQLRALFDESQREQGWIGGVRAWQWWPAFLQFLWNSAERRTAALSIRYEWVNLDRAIVSIPARVRKGGRKGAVYHLWPRTVQLMRQIAEPQREIFFHWPLSDGCYWYRFGRMCRRAGIPDDRSHKTHCIRKTHATHRYIAGQDFGLDHASDETSRKHYIDKSFLTPPPPLFDPWGKAG